MGKIRKCRPREKVQCKAYPPNQPDLPRKGGGLCSLCSLHSFGGHSPKVGVLEHFELVRGLLHPRQGSWSIGARLGLLHQGGGLRALQFIKLLSLSGGRLPNRGGSLSLEAGRCSSSHTDRWWLTGMNIATPPLQSGNLTDDFSRARIGCAIPIYSLSL